MTIITIYFLGVFTSIHSYACRWAIYAGQESESGESLFTLPAHPLCAQTYRKRFTEGLEAAKYFSEEDAVLRNHEINKDGWGIGWYSLANKAKRYRDEDGATDENNITNPDLRRIVGIRSRVILGHVRAASAGKRSAGNSHPFQFNNILWMHNGGIPLQVQEKLQDLIKCSKLHNIVTGTTDSEHLAGFFVSNLIGDVCQRVNFTLRELQSSMRKTITTVEELEDLGKKGKSSLNFAMSDGKHVLVTRYRTNPTEEPPSLFYARTEKALWIASEPLDWRLHDVHREWILLHKDEMLSYTVGTDSLQMECLSEACVEDRKHRLTNKLVGSTSSSNHSNEL